MRLFGFARTDIQSSRLRIRQRSLKASLILLALLVTACTSQTSGAPLSKPRSAPVTTTDTTTTKETATAIGDPRVIVDALDAANLELCHSDYSDGAQYDIYGFFGASATWRFFPHHTAVTVATVDGAALSCVTPSQPNTGVIEIDVYPSAVDASAALRQVGRIWLYAWLYGNVAILLDQTTPLPVAEVAREVLDHLPGTTPFP